MLQSLSNYLKGVLSQHPTKNNFEYSHKVHFSKDFWERTLLIFTICIMKKINLEVSCKRYRFGYLDSCKRLPNFVNVAALMSEEYWGCLIKMSEVNFSPAETLVVETFFQCHDSFHMNPIYTPYWKVPATQTLLKLYRLCRESLTHPELVEWGC